MTTLYEGLENTYSVDCTNNGGATFICQSCAQKPNTTQKVEKADAGNNPLVIQLAAGNTFADGTTTRTLYVQGALATMTKSGIDGKVKIAISGNPLFPPNATFTVTSAKFSATTFKFTSTLTLPSSAAPGYYLLDVIDIAGDTPSSTGNILAQYIAPFTGSSVPVVSIAYSLPTAGTVQLWTLTCQCKDTLGNIAPGSQVLIVLVDDQGNSTIESIGPAGTGTTANPGPASTCAPQYFTLGNIPSYNWAGLFDLSSVDLTNVYTAKVWVTDASGNITPVAEFDHNTLTYCQAAAHGNQAINQCPFDAVTFGNVESSTLPTPVTSSTGWTATLAFYNNSSPPVECTAPVVITGLTVAAAVCSAVTAVETGARFLDSNGQLRTQLLVTPTLAGTLPQVYTIFLCTNADQLLANRIWNYCDNPTQTGTGVGFIENSQPGVYPYVYNPNCGIAVPPANQTWQVYAAQGWFNATGTNNLTTAQMLALCTSQGKASGAYSSTFTMNGCGECMSTDVATAVFSTTSGNACTYGYLDTTKAVQGFTWGSLTFALSTALTNFISNALANPTTEPFFYVNITKQPSDASGNPAPGSSEVLVGSTGLPSLNYVTAGNITELWAILTDPTYNCYMWRIRVASKADTGGSPSNPAGWGTVQNCWGSLAIGTGDHGYFGTYALLRPTGSTQIPVGSLPVNNSLDTTQVNITLSSHTGTFSNRDAVVGSVSGATGVITGGGNSRGGSSPISVMSVVGVFVAGETLNDTTSGAHGVIASVQVTVGIPPAGIFGGTSGLVGASTLTGGSGGNLGTGTVTGGSSGNLVSVTVTAANIASLTITYVQIANVTIQSGQVASQTLLGSNIANGAVQTTQIGSDTVTGGSGGNISIGSVTGATNLASATVITANYAAASVTGGSTGILASTTVTSNNIGNATITYVQVASSTLTGTQIASSTITDSNIASVNASKITTGTITVGSGGMTFSGAGGIMMTGGGNLTTGGSITGTQYWCGVVGGATTTFVVGATTYYVRGGIVCLA